MHIDICLQSIYQCTQLSWGSLILFKSHRWRFLFSTISFLSFFFISSRYCISIACPILGRIHPSGVCSKRSLRSRNQQRNLCLMDLASVTLYDSFDALFLTHEIGPYTRINLCISSTETEVFLFGIFDFFLHFPGAAISSTFAGLCAIFREHSIGSFTVSAAQSFV